MSKVLRRKMVEEYVRKYEGAGNVVLVDPRGMTAAQSEKLRADMREQEIGMNVVKNSVARHAFAKIGLEGLSEQLKDMTGVVYGGDPVAIAKVLHDFKSKNNELPGVRGGIMDGQVVTDKDVVAPSKLPSRDQILSTFLATMNAPVSSFARVLIEVPSAFARVLNAVKDQKEKAG